MADIIFVLQVTTAKFDCLPSQTGWKTLIISQWLLGVTDKHLIVHKVNVVVNSLIGGIKFSPLQKRRLAMKVLLKGPTEAPKLLGIKATDLRTNVWGRVHMLQLQR